MVQARKALVLEGVLPAEVDAIIESMSEPDRSLARIDWEFAPSVGRNNPLVAFVAKKKKWNASKVDSLFETAATL